ncbi:MAG: phage tail assembly chaperone [Lactobacillus sp.]|jgi:endonuclease YncB( thermonuclease family)|nr:phage tail assembly chaperone [Lactobacillus sp.]MCH4067957.1 phage tail assembly chaperone [Lactobacillus sp.]MCI1303604.1 phage tail assembly chaperone [Lactobacillus sp.]MCI1329887.1 phage tail assembly chaperone [Lactobacillus sp.]MCI1399487.1 phage tail assembly chaperone [Lactobacillus sp.]
MTTLIKIDTTPLGIAKKTMQVFPSGAVVDKAQDISIQTLEVPETKSALEAFKIQRDVKLHAKAFLKQLLGLTEKQVEKFNESVTNNDFMAYVGYLIYLLDGSDYETFAEFQDNTHAQNEEAQADPKKPSTAETN